MVSFEVGAINISRISAHNDSAIVFIKPQIEHELLFCVSFLGT